MATAKNIIGGGEREDRVMVTAQQIVKSLSHTPKEVREDMLQILSSFDNRLSSISSLLNGEESKSRFDEAEKLIIQSSEASRKSHLWEDSHNEADEYLAAVDDILDSFNDSSIAGDSKVMYRAQSVIQLAMARLLDEFRHILIRNAVPIGAESLHGSIRKVSLSLALNDASIYENFSSFSDSDSGSVCYHERGASLCGDACVDLINPDVVVELKEIVDRMIRAGYEKECRQVYINVRRDALDECLANLGVEKLGIDEVRKMEWKTLDEKMKKWTQAVKIIVKGLLTSEKRLCDQIFSGSDSMREICFNETTKVGVMQLLNFGEGVSVVKRSSEKLFRTLYMYEALADVFPYLEEMVAYDFVISEAQSVLTALGEAITGTFAEFVNNVKNEASRKPLVGGEIHPLTRYVMNYVKLVVDCSDTLNSLLEGDIDELDALQSDNGDNLKLADMSPIGRHVFLLLSYLESNLEEKSKFYEDGGLQYIFLINNTQYIVRKVKDSELGNLLVALKSIEASMAISHSSTFFLFYATILLSANPNGCNGHLSEPTQTHTKALFVFGDSLFDPGNNQYLPNASLGPCNSLPYGETFFGHATGRFSDGRIVPDFIAQFAKLPILGPYLKPGAHDFTNGSNFASGGAGVLEGIHPGTMSLRTQLSHFKDVKKSLTKKMGSEETEKMLGRAVYLFSMGGNDYFSYYTANPNTTQTDRRRYVSTVVSNLTSVLKEVYMMGGRKIAFQDVGPLGCTPMSIELSQTKSTGRVCVEGISALARMHNRALSSALKAMAARLPGFQYSIFDYYNSLGDRVLNSRKYGFKQGTVPCVSGGKGGSNPGDYVFFDGGHTTERTNSQLAEMIWSGAPNVTGPYNVKQLFAL